MANCGWVTVGVGSQLGSQLGYPGHLAACRRPEEAAARLQETQAAEPRSRY